jgi:hypothetical protein
LQAVDQIFHILDAGRVTDQPFEDVQRGTLLERAFDMTGRRR